MQGFQGTEMVGGGQLQRFSSRNERLSHVYLKDRLHGASEYLRIAGYFRSSIFDLVNEELETISRVRIVCNADLDLQDINAAKHAREQLLIERWNEVDDTVERFLRRPRYKRLYNILRSGNVEIRVVSRRDAPFLHGKAGIIRRPDGSASAFMGSLNETREGWSENYELVWEDSSADGVAWVSDEFEHLWRIGKPLPDAIVDEIGRSANRVEVQIEELQPSDIAPAALVESEMYRSGEYLKPWQRAFIGLFLRHRDMYGDVRLLLADEVGVGKTLSLAGSALVSSLLDDGPVLILCPATLTSQWQIELLDRLNIPSAVWRSSEKAWQIDPDEMPLPSAGPEAILRCPRQIAIVSTGLIFQNTAEREHLLSKKYGMVVLDEAHRARSSRSLGQAERSPNNLLSFMESIARRTRHILLGTATPVQTDVADLWDLMKVLGIGASHVLGESPSRWSEYKAAIPLITGRSVPSDERAAWDWFRNPLPSAKENEVIFGHIRTALGMHADDVCARIPYSGLSDSDDFVQRMFEDEVSTAAGGLTFFQRNNPVVRNVVLRTRKSLEDKGLIPRIAVDIHPVDGQPLPHMFDGLGLRTSASFDAAYQSAEKFTNAFSKRQKSANLLRGLLLERLCSSYAAGIATATKLLDGRQRDEEEEAAFGDEVVAMDDERVHLSALLNVLRQHPTDPKLDAVLYFLIDRGWLNRGCIVFSRYYDTVRWIAGHLTARLPAETVAIYAGAGKSGMYLGGEWHSVARNQIKKAIRERLIRIVVATDAACEGLNLQSLGTLINIDLPWNPSRLEQRIGRIKRIGQRLDRVDMLNLVYHGTRDETIYRAISTRMKDRYDIFGSLPDVIEDEWIDNIEKLDERLKDFTTKRRQANAFELRYATDIEDDRQTWEKCERVLSRRDVTERLSRGW
jgi:superfamily II DNA or RNA helicase